MAELAPSPKRRTVGVADIPRVFFTPRRVFARVEDVPHYGWPLVLLLTCVTLIGWATVETGLIDREVDRGIGAALAKIDAAQEAGAERAELREAYEEAFKAGEFKRLITRIQVVVAEPAKALAHALLIAAVLYGAVALTGRKPEWHTLLTLCVFAGFIDVLRLLTRLGLMLRHGTLDVDTSAAVLTPHLLGTEGLDPQQYAAVVGLLTAVDPFRIWYWVVLAIGLTVTAQLPGWRGKLVCVLGWLVGAGLHCGMALASASAAGPPPA